MMSVTETNGTNDCFQVQWLIIIHTMSYDSYPIPYPYVSSRHTLECHSLHTRISQSIVRHHITTRSCVPVTWRSPTRETLVIGTDHYHSNEQSGSECSLSERRWCHYDDNNGRADQNTMFHVPEQHDHIFPRVWISWISKGMLSHDVKWTDSLNVHLVWRSTPPSISRNGYKYPPKSGIIKDNKRHQSLTPLCVADHTIPCGIDILPQLIQAIWSNNMMPRESVLKARLMSSLSRYIHEWPPNASHTETKKSKSIQMQSHHDWSILLEKMWRNQQVHLLDSTHRLSHSTHKHAMAMRDKSNKILTSFHDVEVRWKSPLKTAMTRTIRLVPGCAVTTKVKAIIWLMVEVMWGITLVIV
jgi:hypothetical protein